MTDHTEKFYDLEVTIKERVPGFKIKFKDESLFMKTIGKVLFFNKSFMTGYVTTIGKTVYFPSRAVFEKDPGAYFYILSHEYVHIMDYVEHPVIFTLGYMFPQILAAFSIFSILALINPYFLLFLISLLFAAPIPAPYRTWAELRGYGMTCKARLWDGCSEDLVQDLVKTRYVNNFTKSGYYFMCPFKKYIIKKLLKWVADDNCLSDHNPAFMDVYNIIKQN